jgi:TATA element modulatory factor
VLSARPPSCRVPERLALVLELPGRTGSPPGPAAVAAAMAEWKAAANQWDDDGDGWEDVAAVAKPPPRPKLKPTAAGKRKPPIIQDGAADADGTPGAGGTANGDGAASGADTNESPADAAPAAPSGAPTAAANGDGSAAETAAAKKALAASERRVAALTRERDALRRARDSRAGGLENAREKDKQIAKVLEEGQALSVKVAEAETAARAARYALKEREAELEAMCVACGAAEAKAEAAAAKFRTVETSERAAVEGKDAAERRMRQMESDARTKSSSSAALDAARGQLEALRKSQSAALENQAMRLRADADAEREKCRERAAAESEALKNAMAELRAHLSQVTENAGWREDQLRKEAAELRARAESLEARNEELAEAVPGATRPLLRQVEALQAAASERARAMSAVERSQLDRLRAAEAAVAAGVERERAADVRIGSLLSRIAALEEQVKIANAEASRVAAALRDAQSAAADAELAHRRALDTAQVHTMKAVREREAQVDELSKARAAHLDEAEACEKRERTLREKVGALEAKLEAAHVQTARQLAVPGAASSSHMFGPASGGAGDGAVGFGTSDSMSSLLQSPRGSRLAGLTDGDPPGSAGGLRDLMSPGRYSEGAASVASFAESSSAPGGVYDTERLHSTLRQRIGEIASLHSQLTSKETATQALADEVVALTARVEELTAELKDAPEVRSGLSDLTVRHAALLELLGEREERIQELEADLVDINQMYKAQITDLLLRLET